MSAVFGKQVNPTEVTPVIGSTGPEQNLMQAIMNTIPIKGYDASGTGYPSLTGISPYPGQVNPDANNTILPQVYGAWQPWDAGTGYLANSLSKFDPNKTSPILQNMMQYGGTGGPGNQGMAEMMQFGTPSQAGQYESNLANFGGSSPQTAQPLNDLAYGKMSGPSKYLAPFLTASPYKAASITRS